MKKTILLLGAACCVAVGITSCGNDAAMSDNGAPMDTATAMSSPSTTPEAPAQSEDATLTAELVQSMHGGIALMKQAEQKATTPDVKALAKKLDMAHTKLTDEMTALAGKKGWTVPSGPSEEDNKVIQEMAAEQDMAAYEKKWLSTLKDKHETNIKKLEDAKPADADLKAAGEKALPKLHELLSSIEVVQKKMK